MVELGVVWGEEGEQETTGGLRNGSREGGKGWDERRNLRTPTTYRHLGEVESLRDNKPMEGTTLRLSGGRPGGMAMFDPHRDGDSMSRAENRLDRMQEEIGGRRGG